jgi:hypothetical protein
LIKTANGLFCLGRVTILPLANKVLVFVNQPAK